MAEIVGLNSFFDSVSMVDLKENCKNKLILSERPFKILQNETKNH